VAGLFTIIVIGQVAVVPAAYSQTAKETQSKTVGTKVGFQKAHEFFLKKEGDPVEEILKVIGKEKIDLVILRSHEESRIEHFLVGSSNDAIIRKMPCSVLLVKKEPGPGAS